VAVGAVTALWVAAGLAILGGRGLLKVIPVKWLSRGAAVVMLVLAGLTVAALF
jgi:putative Ca2+/H+ antiporter (TMEM165/GDT1 family)